MRRFKKWTPKEKRDEVVLMYLSGENSVEELGEYYNVNPSTIRTWIKRYRQSKSVVSLQAQTKSVDDMAQTRCIKHNTLIAMELLPPLLHYVE